MTGVATARTAVRHRIRVTGVVQGVGFRPFVHRLATELGLAGHVGNDTGGVFVEVEGQPSDVARFERRLLDEPLLWPTSPGWRSPKWAQPASASSVSLRATETAGRGRSFLRTWPYVTIA